MMLYLTHSKGYSCQLKITKFQINSSSSCKIWATNVLKTPNMSVTIISQCNDAVDHVDALFQFTRKVPIRVQVKYKIFNTVW